MDNRVKELISIGVSVAVNCQPCLQYHVDKALKSGAKEQEITEAIEVGKTIRKVSASKMDKFASSVTQHISSGTTASDEGCGCGS